MPKRGDAGNGTLLPTTPPLYKFPLPDLCWPAKDPTAAAVAVGHIQKRSRGWTMPLPCWTLWQAWSWPREDPLSGQWWEGSPGINVFAVCCGFWQVGESLWVTWRSFQWPQWPFWAARPLFFPLPSLISLFPLNFIPWWAGWESVEGKSNWSA